MFKLNGKRTPTRIQHSVTTLYGIYGLYIHIHIYVFVNIYLYICFFFISNFHVTRVNSPRSRVRLNYFITTLCNATMGGTHQLKLTCASTSFTLKLELDKNWPFTSNLWRTVTRMCNYILTDPAVLVKSRPALYICLARPHTIRARGDAF